MSIEHPGGVVGDIEAALLRSGFGHLDSVEMAEAIVLNGIVGFRTDKLGKAGIDPLVLVHELRSTGLIVRWSGEG